MGQCTLCAPKRTFVSALSMSALCQKRTWSTDLNNCVARGPLPDIRRQELVHVSQAEPCAEPVAPQSDRPWRWSWEISLMSSDLQLSQCGSAQAFLPGLPISLRAFFAWHWHDGASRYPRSTPARQLFPYSGLRLLPLRSLLADGHLRDSKVLP